MSAEFERHADLIDRASDLEARSIEDAIANARIVKPLLPTGFCINPRCESPVEHPKKYCDSLCAEEHALIEKLKGSRK